MNLSRNLTIAILAGAIAGAIPSIVRADEPTTTTAPAASAVLPACVQNAMSPSTLGVIAMDASRIDLNAMQTWMAAGLAQNIPDKMQQGMMIQSSAEQLKHGQDWIDKFTKAGGKELFVILDMSVIQQNPPVMIVPLPPGADGHAIGALLQSGDPKGAFGPQANAPQSGQGSSYSEATADCVI